MEQENLKHKTKVGLYWSFFNQFANNGLQFVVGIVMARLLSPEDYGITALPAVFMTERIIHNNALSIIATIISLLNFIICLVLCSKDIKEAIVRKFHM